MKKVRLIYLCPQCDPLYDPKGLVKHVDSNTCRNIQQGNRWFEKLGRDTTRFQICPTCGARLGLRTDIAAHQESCSCIADTRAFTLKKQGFARLRREYQCFAVFFRNKLDIRFEETSYSLPNWRHAGHFTREVWVPAWLNAVLQDVTSTHGSQLEVGQAAFDKIVEAASKGKPAIKVLQAAAALGGRKAVEEVVFE